MGMRHSSSRFPAVQETQSNLGSLSGDNDERDIRTEARAVARRDYQHGRKWSSWNQPPARAQSVEAVDRGDLPCVRLDNSDLDLIVEQAGTARAASCDGSIWNHKVGVAGELAVAKQYDRIAAVDIDIYDGRGDGGSDLSLAGLEVDVKTRSNPILDVDMGGLRADVYFLVHKESKRDYRLIGYVSAEVVEDAPMKETDYGEYRRVVPASSLWPAPRDEQDIVYASE